MADPFPTHIGDVQQTVDTTQIDEGTEVGDVLDDTLAELSDFQFAQQVIAIFLALLFDQRPAADHDIASRFVDLENFALHDASDVVGDIVGTSNIDLAGWQEDVDADIDQQATLDLASDGTGDDLAFGDLGHHLFPLQDLFRLAFAQRDHAVDIVCRTECVLHLFDQHLDGLSNGRRLFRFVPFIDIDCTFALEANIDDDIFTVDFHDLAIDDLIDVKGLVEVLLASRES